MLIPLKDAAHLLNQGHVVAVPTETVYGLAASIHQEKAIAEIFKIKGRPSNNPLIVHVSSFEEIKYFADTLPPFTDLLASHFWPGAMTLVLPVKKELISSSIRANLSTAAFRIPSHKDTLELLKLTGPLVMPSANTSGKPSSTQATHVETDFGKEFPVLQGVDSEKGLESTILIFNNKWEIIRLGAIASEEFTDILGYTPLFQKPQKGEQPQCPGQLYRHYAPKAKLQLITSFSEENTGFIVGFSNKNYPDNTKLFSLGDLNYPEIVCANLYKILRELDNNQIESAWVDMDFPREGILITLAERLEKAANK